MRNTQEIIIRYTIKNIDTSKTKDIVLPGGMESYIELLKHLTPGNKLLGESLYLHIKDKDGEDLFTNDIIELPNKDIGIIGLEGTIWFYDYKEPSKQCLSDLCKNKWCEDKKDYISYLNVKRKYKIITLK